jgi:hypothetical protein
MTTITKRIASPSHRRLLAAAAGLALLVLPAAQAFAFSNSVMSACADDYLTYCSSYDLDDPKVRQCMRAAASRLSQACVNALVASGEVSKREAARYSSSER